MADDQTEIGWTPGIAAARDAVAPVGPQSPLRQTVIHALHALRKAEPEADNVTMVASVVYVMSTWFSARNMSPALAVETVTNILYFATDLACADVVSDQLGPLDSPGWGRIERAGETPMTVSTDTLHALAHCARAGREAASFELSRGAMLAVSPLISSLLGGSHDAP